MSNATLCIRAHFDGRFIIPDEPVDLPLGAPLDIEVRSSLNVSRESTEIMSISGNPDKTARRLTGFAEFMARVEKRSSGPGIPAEALRREAMYGDQGR